jgi:hypothetical protein
MKPIKNKLRDPMVMPISGISPIICSSDILIGSVWALYNHHELRNTTLRGSLITRIRNYEINKR